MYNGNKYLAVDIPYSPAYHNWGYQFSGWTTSTGESMKCVPYLVNGQPVNQTLISNIQDFVPNMVETHMTAGFNITGKVGIFNWTHRKNENYRNRQCGHWDDKSRSKTNRKRHPSFVGSRRRYEHLTGLRI